MAAPDPTMDALAFLIEQTHEDEDNGDTGKPKDYVNKTEVSSILPWGQVPRPEQQQQGSYDSYEQEGGARGSTSEPAAPGSPFGPDWDLNQRIRLFIGETGSLEVDAVAFDFSYWSFTKTLGKQLLRLGGSKLTKELSTVDRMRSGQAEICKGNFGNLHCKFLIPFVGPNYKDKYKTAARNTLSYCVRAALEKCQEQGYKTFAFPVFYADEKAFPLEENVHIVLRTLRRWLPKLDKIRAVVLYTNIQYEAGAVAQLLPLYFPRNTLDSMEGMEVTRLIPDFTFGTETGEEPQEEGRSLKISNLVINRSDGSDDDDEPIVKSDFIEHNDNRDVDRLDAALWDATTPDELVHIYMKYVREAKSPMYKKSMEELAAVKFLYHAGKDMMGRDVIFFSEAIVPIVRYDIPVILRYIVSTIDPYANNSFILVYAHGGVSTSQAIWDIFKELMIISQLKYEKTLVNFLVLHPTLAFKAAFSMSSYYMPESIYNNAIYFETIADLRRYIGNQDMEISPCVRTYEHERNDSLFGSLW